MNAQDDAKRKRVKYGDNMETRLQSSLNFFRCAYHEYALDLTQNRKCE